MKRLKTICLVLAVSLISGLTCGAANAAPLPAEEQVGVKGTEAAPPFYLDVCIQVGDSDRIEIGSYPSALLRAWAKRSNMSDQTLKYSSASYSGYAGRVVREYIPLTDFVDYVSTASEIPVAYDSGDYLIMGEDFTKDPAYSNYSREELTGNWYSYDSMIGTKRYYFPYWNAGDATGSKEVPAVIGIRSYGNSSGVTDAILDYYSASADYLWAYVIYFGQTNVNELTYPYFYYGQDELAFEYPDDGLMNDTIRTLLTKEVAVAGEYLENTIAADSGDSVAQGNYWVTHTEYNALKKIYETAEGLLADEQTKNREAFDVLADLQDEDETFGGLLKPGQKSGFFWYTEHKEGTPYRIMSAEQLWELSMLVNGTAYDEKSLEYFDADSFEGETIVLERDIDAGGIRPCIGTASCPFDGTFDGQNHSVSGLSITGLKSVVYVGPFGYIGTDGCVKNLTLSGVIDSDASCVGGIAAFNGGRIENCHSMMKINDDNTMNGICGGIAGKNTGQIINCLGAGTIFGGSVSGSIAGRNAGNITGCVGKTAISGEPAKEGLAAENSGIVFNCISESTKLCSSNTGTFSSSYTLAKETGITSGTYEDLFCDDGNTDLTSKEVFERLSAKKDKASETGSVFVQIADGCPLLEWQVETSIGDVNRDGFTDCKDAAMVKRYLAEKMEFDDYQCLSADYNRDGSIDLSDVRAIALFGIGVDQYSVQ